MKTHLNTILTYIIVIIFLVSCSGKPSVSQAENDLSEKISNESNGNLILIDFDKLNAMDREFFGQKTYVIKFKGKLRVEKDCFMYVNKTGFGRYFHDFKTYKEQPLFNPSFQKQIVLLTKGKEVIFEDEIIYLKTEEGWVR